MKTPAAAIELERCNGEGCSATPWPRFSRRLARFAAALPFMQEATKVHRAARRRGRTTHRATMHMGA